MAVMMRSNGLHHAVSLGTIEVSSKSSYSTSQFDRSYDSEDENMSRRRLRHTSSTELYPRPSVYSKGDIREQYCLTDRQLHTIERPRRDKFFGCLSRRNAQQTFLGGCVGRRAPSDENLAAYAPYPRYRHHSPDHDMDSSYFRRQPASILSAPKITDTTSINAVVGGGVVTGAGAGPGAGATRIGIQTVPANKGDTSNFHLADQSSYHCPAYGGTITSQIAPPQSGPTTPRTKHVSFARSHTLTSFDDANLNIRSSGRFKAASGSQERLIGGKKPIMTHSAAQTICETLPTGNLPQSSYIGGSSTLPMVHTHSHVHPHIHNHGHNHHSHLHGQPIAHVHQFMPTVHTDQPITMLGGHPIIEDYSSVGIGILPYQKPPSPEVLVVEKKFRNAMKTQATQTDVRKDKISGQIILPLSPRASHKITVVSQGAQTNGLLNGKKLTKSLSEMPIEIDGFFGRSHLQEAPNSPLERTPSVGFIDMDSNINYYKPPPPLASIQTNRMYQVQKPTTFYSSLMGHQRSQFYPNDNLVSLSSMESNTTESMHRDLTENYCMGNGFDYESNSLPRRTCGYHQRVENEFSSNSLPRREPIHAHDICKHITECSELSTALELNSLDFNRMPLLPPPRQYRKEENHDEPDEDEDEEDEEDEDDEEDEETPAVPPIDYPEINRRMSMVLLQKPDFGESPFRRDDVRRKSMPVYVKTEKLIDGPHHARSSFRTRGRYNAAIAASEEKEIFIDFKPLFITKFSPRKIKKDRNQCRTSSETEILIDNDEPKEHLYENNVIVSEEGAKPMNTDLTSNHEDPLYENIHGYLGKLTDDEKEKAKDNFRKRSISLDSGEQEDKVNGISAPASPGREGVLANASTYPSSDSLANDVTRDHSDGIWNESQVTILTAEQKDISDSSFTSNLLLTPTTRRKNLLLQHQQRSSVDTDALDLEEQFTDHSPTYSNASITKKSITSQAATHQELLPGREIHKSVMKMITPSIAVTPSYENTPELITKSPINKPIAAERKSSLVDNEVAMQMQQKSMEMPTHGRIESAKFTNADISECSTNTDEYATCTDTSKRTPGIKTPPTITSSSSTTQVPVSTQNSQITDKTHGGSSFESASSLYSNRGDILPEDFIQPDDKVLKHKYDKESKLGANIDQCDEPKVSPAHSISSISSGSYHIGDEVTLTANGKNAIEEAQAKMKADMNAAPTASEEFRRDRPKIKPESISDDERSEIRYSSSGYYESPHDEEQRGKRYRQNEEERKKRKTSMKLDIERENLRALTSPIKKPNIMSIATTETITTTTMTSTMLAREKLIDTTKQLYNRGDITSPNRMKRFRPKIRRQLRKASRDESSPRRPPKYISGIYTPIAYGSTEKLLDSIVTIKSEPRPDVQEIEDTKVTMSATSPSTIAGSSKLSSETCQLKTKSIESLRSVSPGSDSVFYSEADGNAIADQPCLHCGKGLDGQNFSISAIEPGDSVESLPCIENDNGEQDIVKPPSDFADSPVATKTTQRLYKKMDKRFRSEERYHKTRQENIRAKSEERSQETHTRSPLMLRPSGSSPSVLPDVPTEQNQHVIYRGHYDCGRYTRLTDTDVWTQLNHQSFERHRERRASTESERSFHSKYQVILHRLVQRRCTLEMYHRQKNNKFQLIVSNSSADSMRRKLEEILKLMLLVWAREGYVLSILNCEQFGVDKTIVVRSDSGEFGFRIHGSKPVVVAAIEPDTPAESSGLEVGDIIISVNGVQVLDKHHTEVVKIAHDGCDKLELQVARTIGVLMNEQRETSGQPIYSGFLWRQSGQAKGAPNSKKWVRRWFCLRPDNCLYYYKTDNDTQPVGAMIMAKHTVDKCSSDVGKPFAFKIDSGEGIPMFVAADSDDSTNRWIKILKQSATQENTWLDKCTRNLYQPPSSILRPECFGFLMKLGSRWCGWSKRYCVLKDACLYFYQDANSKSAFGMACIHGYKVASMSTNAAGRKNSFEIIPPDSKLRHYYFSTESEMDKKRWISALEYSIDRWIKSG